MMTDPIEMRRCILYRKEKYITTGTYSTVRYQYASGSIKCQSDCLVIFLYSIPFAANNNDEEEFSLSSLQLKKIYNTIH